MKDTIFTGILDYKEYKFTFVFDGEILRLVSVDKVEFSSFAYEEITPGVYSPRIPVVEERVIHGLCNETSRELVFIMSVGSPFWQRNDVYFIKPLAYIDVWPSGDNINRVTLSGLELDHIYPVSYAYKTSVKDEKGFFEVESLPPETYTSEKQHFIFREKEIQSYFSITKFLYFRRNQPLEFSSKMVFDFEGVDDYYFLYELINVGRSFIQYLCYRRNIKLESIDLFAVTSSGSYRRRGELVLNRNIVEDNFSEIQDRFIPYSAVKGFEGKILQDIADEKLYMRHLPLSFENGKHITPAFFIMVTTAFEWEFTRIYPNGVPKSEKSQKVQEEVYKLIQGLIDDASGKVKDKLKFLQRRITDEKLSNKIQFVTDNDFDLIKQIGEYLYTGNSVEYDIPDIGERIADKRNDFAHGNLGKDFEDITLIDIVFLERVVYVMQLKYIGLSKEMIFMALNQLFHMHRIYQKANDD